MSSKGQSLQMSYQPNRFGKNLPKQLIIVDRSKYTGDRLREIRKRQYNFLGELQR